MNDADALHVLLVEDDRDAAEALQLLLEMRGCTVRWAPSAETALALQETWHPNVVITDLGMPGMDGRQLAVRLRAADPHLVIIALSGTAPPQDWNAAQTAMFDHYLIKPLNLDVLERLLGLKR